MKLSHIRNSCMVKPLAVVMLFCTLSLTTQAGGGSEVVVASGTSVPLQSSETMVFDKTHHQGEKITFRVSGDVVVNGQIAIRGGTPVDGIVNRFEKPRGIGKPGSVTIDFSNVRAVDGSMVALSSCTLRNTGENREGLAIGLGVGLGFFFLPLLALLAIKGKPAIVESDTNMNCYVMTAATVKVN